MSIKYVSTNDALVKNIPPPSVPVPVAATDQAAWTRPSDWLALPSVGPTDQKFVGLMAVTNDSSNYVALLAVTSAGTYTVDWGDGSSPVTYTSNTQANYQYNYATISSGTISTLGYKQVIITVTATTANLTSVDLQQVLSNTTLAPGGFSTAPVYKWLDISVGSPNLTSLQLSATSAGSVTVSLRYLEQVNVVSVASTYTTMNYMFSSAPSLRSVVNVPLQYVTSATNMFAQDYKLTSIPAIFANGGNLTGSGVNNMFQNCYSLSNVVGFTGQSFPKLTTLSDTFNGCATVKFMPALNTPNVTTYVRTFANCNALITVENFNTTNATSMSLLFQGCKSLVSVPNFDTSKVLTFTGMFQNCTTLKTAPTFNYSNATDTAQMFSSCSSLNSVPKMSLPKVTSTYSMFNATNITGIDIINTGNVTNANIMFQSCTSLTSAPAMDTTKVTDMASMFSGCFKLYDTSNIANYNTSNATSTAGMFQTCNSLQVAPAIDMTKVINAVSMFNGCSSLISVPTYTTSNVTNAASMFQNCISLPTMPLIDTTKVTNVTSMFNGCSSLNSVPAFNTSNVTAFTSMYQNCTSLRLIPNIDTSKGTTFGSFSTGSGITSIPAFNLTNATTLGTAFNSSALCQSNVTNSKVSISYASSELGKASLESIFTNLSSNSVSQTITITTNPGADTAFTKTVGMTAGNLTLTMANTVNVAVGQHIYSAGTIGIGSFQVCSLTGGGSSIVTTSGANGFITANTMVSFSSITTTTGISTYTPYYAINISGNTFQLSNTPGGSAITLTNNGSGSIGYSSFVTGVTANTSITVSAAPYATTASTTVTLRILNTSVASLKNWAITG